MRIPREQSGERRERRERLEKFIEINEGKIAENISRTACRELVKEEVILGFDSVTCHCNNGKDGRGVDSLLYLKNGLMLGIQVKKDPGNSRKREKRVDKHYKIHPFVQKVIFVSIDKPTAYMDVFWEVVEYLKGAALDSPIPEYFLAPAPKTKLARH